MSIFDDITGLAHKIEAAVENEAHKLEGDVKTEAPAVQAAIKVDVTKVATDLHDALLDVLPSHWEANHPSANLFAKAKAALEAFEAWVKAKG